MTNVLRLNLYPQNVRVASLHVGYMDTDMTAGVEAPKSNPADIVKIAIDGLESDSFEIIADDFSLFYLWNQLNIFYCSTRPGHLGKPLVKIPPSFRA